MIFRILGFTGLGRFFDETYQTIIASNYRNIKLSQHQKIKPSKNHSVSA